VLTARQRSRSWADPTVGGWSVLDVAAAIVLSIGAALSAYGVLGSNPHPGSVAAGLGVIGMTAPVAWRRRAPLAAAATLAAGAVLNAALFGSLVRCGAALPAVFLVALALGTRAEQTRTAAGLGLGLCAVNVIVQAFYDPQLGWAVLPFLLPIVVGFFALGRVIRSWTLAADALQRQTATLRRQREETARVSVAADRARLSGELDSGVRRRIEGICSSAAEGAGLLATDPFAASELLSVIEQDARGALHQMRELVGALGSPAHSAPTPTLAEVPLLLAAVSDPSARLRVDGDARRLPTNVELSGYRIVEHLLSALDDGPRSQIDVRLTYELDSFELRVAGALAHDVDFDSVLAVARERVDLHHGSLEGSTQLGRCYAHARLPLVSRYA
jgi:signal transduction histidine kinase